MSRCVRWESLGCRGRELEKESEGMGGMATETETDRGRDGWEVSSWDDGASSLQSSSLSSNLGAEPSPLLLQSLS